ncbi:hypothetical protein OBBRIDRAFT_436150 [Obba rivulosa]|uniref:Uncharacterized protein n=1 Tax=Obba rivulosa TaxID=1052685 RepID=A0A8E2AX03_9APHY|nr:hypothetical protein OBBRIDRAFT_436150 [Obba rivulosa]
MGIVLDPDEPPIVDEGVIELQYMPVYVLVKLTRMCALKLDGLEECVILIEPSSITMQVSVQGRAGSSVLRKTVRRRQFSTTGAYAFIDYRAQGQTIPIVLIDIQTPPPPGTLTLLNLYVTLSRSSG